MPCNLINILFSFNISVAYHNQLKFDFKFVSNSSICYQEYDNDKTLPSLHLY